MAMFTAYFDESGHHADQDKIITIGGLVLSENDGVILGEKWDKRLRRERKLKGEPFHATDFKNRHQVFSELDDDEWSSLRSDLTAIIINNMAIGFAHSIVINDWNRVLSDRFPDGFEKKRATYILLIQTCLEQILERVSIPQGETLACMFEANKFTRTAIERHYIDLKQHSHFTGRLGSHSFGGKEYPQLQAADLIAHSGYDRLLNRQNSRLALTHQAFSASGLVDEGYMDESSFWKLLASIAEKEKSWEK
jgi:Protein of unknown function (DUF3800)